MEKQLHLTLDNIPWEFFEERLSTKYFPPYYEEKQEIVLHALDQGRMIVEKYEMRFMDLVKYFPNVLCMGEIWILGI